MWKHYYIKTRRLIRISLLSQYGFNNVSFLLVSLPFFRFIYFLFIESRYHIMVMDKFVNKEKEIINLWIKRRRLYSCKTFYGWEYYFGCYYCFIHTYCNEKIQVYFITHIYRIQVYFITHIYRWDVTKIMYII